MSDNKRFTPLLLLVLLGVLVAFGYLVVLQRRYSGSFLGLTSVKDQCQNCGAINYKSELDERLGIVHASGDYPDKTGSNFLFYGAKEAYRYGFRTMELWLTPNLCSAHVLSRVKSNGFYQTKKWCQSDTTIGFKESFDSLMKLAGSEDFAYVLGMPFKNFIINVDSLNPRGLTQAKVQSSDNVASKEEKAILYQQVYDLASLLLTRYRGSSKTFILVSTNELENRLTAYSGCNDNWRPGNKIECGAVPAGKVNSTNAISFINTIQQAVSDARLALKSDVKVYHAAEVSHVVSKKMGVLSALTEVLPFTNADLYSYSAHEIRGMAVDRSGEDPYRLMQSALNKLEKAAPDSKIFGKKNLFIGEISLGETNAKTEAYPRFERVIKSAMDWGVKYVVYWAFTDSGCDKFGTVNNDNCNGLWVVRPDGTSGRVYDEILSAYTKSKYSGDLRYGAEMVSMKIDGRLLTTGEEIAIDRNKGHVISVMYKNSGTLSWTTNDGVFLGKVDVGDISGGYGVSEIPPWKVIKPGQYQSFEIKIPKRSKAVTELVQWQMTKSKLERFGQKTYGLVLEFE